MVTNRDRKILNENAIETGQNVTFYVHIITIPREINLLKNS